MRTRDESPSRIELCDDCVDLVAGKDGHVRCPCGSLIARFVDGHVELKCRRCKRTLMLPLEGAAPSGRR